MAIWFRDAKMSDASQCRHEKPSPQNDLCPRRFVRGSGRKLIGGGADGRAEFREHPTRIETARSMGLVEIDNQSGEAYQSSISAIGHGGR